MGTAWFWIDGKSNDLWQWIDGSPAPKRMLLDSDENISFAIAHHDGNIFTAGQNGIVTKWSPSGNSFKAIPAGHISAGYVWNLMSTEKGLFAFSGNPGQVFKLTKQNKTYNWKKIGPVLDDHITAVTMENNTFFIGTSPEALLIELDFTNIDRPKIHAIRDFSESEISLIIRHPDQTLMVALHENAQVNNQELDNKQPSVFSRKQTDANSSVYLIKNKQLKTIWQNEPILLRHGIFWNNRFWVSAGPDALLISIDKDGFALEAAWQNNRVAGFASSNDKLECFLGDDLEKYDIYTQHQVSGYADLKPLSFKEPSVWDHALIMGQFPSSTSVSLSLRFGPTSWSKHGLWSNWIPAKKLSSLDVQRFNLGSFKSIAVQCRLILKSGNPTISPILDQLEIRSSLPNHAPKFVINPYLLPSGQIKLHRSLSNKEPLEVKRSPMIEGPIRTFNSDSAMSSETYYKQGGRTLIWQTKDQDNDNLTYSIKLIFSGANNKSTVLVDHLEDSFYSFDTKDLLDGWYRLSVDARDDFSHIQQKSSWFEVDNTPPTLSIKGNKLTVIDNGSGVFKVRYRIKSTPNSWKILISQDGSAGSGQELYLLPKASDIWIDARDLQGNRSAIFHK